MVKAGKIERGAGKSADFESGRPAGKNEEETRRVKLVVAALQEGKRIGEAAGQKLEGWQQGHHESPRQTHPINQAGPANKGKYSWVARAQSHAVALPINAAQHLAEVIATEDSRTVGTAIQDCGRGGKREKRVAEGRCQTHAWIDRFTEEGKGAADGGEQAEAFELVESEAAGGDGIAGKGTAGQSGSQDGR